MKLDGLLDLGRIDVFAKPSFIFALDSDRRQDLITRYRATVCTGDSSGATIRAWQKSIYRFGGLHRQVPMAVTVSLDASGLIKNIEIDAPSRGSQGKNCDFACLEASLRDKLISNRFVDFSRIYKDAGTTGCLHIFEILSGASSFYELMCRRGLTDGSEQELLRISPYGGGIQAVNEHEVLGKTAVTELSLKYNAKPGFGKKGLPESLDADVSVDFNGKAAASSRVRANDFAGCYSGLNRCFTRAYNAEKKFFDVPGKQRFSNLPSLVGLVVLALSHEGMSGTLSRAAKLESILIFLQTGEGREGCIGFRGGLNLNQKYLLGATLSVLALCASAAAALCLKRRI